jgi:Phage tail protein (Tail_P2_I)
MRLLDLAAVPHPSGNRIDLTWVHPTPIEFPGVRVVRRERTHPLSPTPASAQQGVVIAETNPTSPGHNRIQVRADGSYTASDTGLRGETVYYYALFPYAGNPPAYDIDRRNRAEAMATAPYNSAGQMAELLPALYHRYDTAIINAATVAPADREKGQLRRFLDLPGSELDLLYSFAMAVRDLHDVEKVDSRLLLLLAQWIGWQTDHRLEIDVQRNDIRNAPHLYQSIGLIPTVEATVKRLVGWESRTKEFVHNVFRSNQPERFNLWAREQNSAGVWSIPSAPLSLDFAYEGRPTAVRDPGGVLWLFYHTLRKGHWDIWYKNFREGRGWTPSEPLTNRRLIDKYPTPVLHGAALRVFWSAYDESGGLWQINFRTRTSGQWSPVAPLSALAPFASDAVSRRTPWAVTDNAGMLWLFWLELVGQQWQLRYNRYDGTNWALATPATFPADAGADPRVEAAPFVVFHPTDAAQRLWVFWARTEPIGSSGQRRWRIVYRVKASLNPSAADWSAVRALPPGPAESQDREPAVLVKANGDVELFWSSTRKGSWSIWRATVNRTTHAWGTAEILINSPHTQCDPLPIAIATGTMLVYHANESVKYTSAVYAATETVDHRYAGSTTVDVGNTAKRGLWGTFDDFQTFTSDCGQNGERANADQYARETVGLYLTPDTTDPTVIQRNQNLLRNALREFLPAPVRTVFKTEST